MHDHTPRPSQVSHLDDAFRSLRAAVDASGIVRNDAEQLKQINGSRALAVAVLVVVVGQGA